MLESLTRRKFIATCSGTIAALAVSRGGPAHAEAGARPSGPVYGRIGKRGIGPGTASNPARGEVILLDGGIIEAAHVTGEWIRPGGSVWLTPEPDGTWSILYAEFPA